MKNFGGKETNKGKEKSRFLTGAGLSYRPPFKQFFNALC